MSVSRLFSSLSRPVEIPWVPGVQSTLTYHQMGAGPGMRKIAGILFMLVGCALSGVSNLRAQQPTIVVYNPAVGSNLWGITQGPDGNLWFVEYNNGRVGRITLGGVVSVYPTPTQNSNPYTIATGPDGNLWFTEPTVNKIGRITPSGVITEYSIPSSNAIRGPAGITPGPDVQFPRCLVPQCRFPLPLARMAIFGLPGMATTGLARSRRTVRSPTIPCLPVTVVCGTSLRAPTATSGLSRRRPTRSARSRLASFCREMGWKWPRSGRACGQTTAAMFHS